MANQKKCQLGLTEAQSLGYRIGQGLLKPQEKKLEAVRGYPQPTSKKQVDAFLGLEAGTCTDIWGTGAQAEIKDTSHNYLFLLINYFYKIISSHRDHGLF